MRRVGWIRTGALGDLLVGLASLRETLDRWPDSRVTVVGPKLWLQIIEPGAWPQIDRIVTLERKASSGDVYEFSETDQWKLIESRRPLSAEFRGYDAIFNTRVDSPREGFPALWAGVPERWGAASGLAKWIYTHRATHFGKDPLIHERDVPLLLMDEAAGDEMGLRLRSISTLQGKVDASPRIAKWKKLGLPCPRRLMPKLNSRLRTEILVNPTSSRREKAWPAEKFRDFLPRLRKWQAEANRTGAEKVSIKVVGAPSETEWLNEVAQRDGFEILQPKSIGELFQVVSQARLLITNTSSMQFIAAATETPAVTLMGRARPEIWGPLGPYDRVVRGSEPAGVEDLFERERRAYESISVDKVLNEIKSQM